MATTTATITHEVVALPMAQIRPGDNDRTVFNRAELEALADSIRVHGLAQPITVRPMDGASWFQIVAGERRFRACQLLGWGSIPAIVRAMSEAEASSIMLIENVHRADIDPIDEAQAYAKRMAQFGWTERQVAEHAQVDVDRVRRRLKLLQVAEDIRPLIRSGQIPLGHAELLAGLDQYRQSLALRLFQGKTIPSQSQFRQVVGELLAEQSQMSMLDLLNGWQEHLEARGDKERRKRTGLPTHPAMPDLPPGKGTIGQCLQRYIETVASEGLEREALALSHMLDQLVQRGWTAL